MNGILQRAVLMQLVLNFIEKVSHYETKINMYNMFAVYMSIYKVN